MAKSIQYLAWGSITSGDRWTEPPIPSQLWLFSDCHFHGLSPCWSLTHLNGFDNGFHHPSSMVLLDPTWRLPLACLLENLFMGNDRLFRPSEFALGSVKTAERYMSQPTESRLFLQKREYTHFSWAREDTEHHRPLQSFQKLR